MTGYDDILSLLDNQKFGEAEKSLLQRRKQDYSDPYVNYLLGWVYNDYKNPKRSAQEAQRFFSFAVNSAQPIDDAFVQLAKLEQNRKHAVRILKKGLTHFPASQPIYDSLLRRSERNERVTVFQEMKEKNILTSYSRMVMVQTYFEQKEFKLASEMIPAIETDDNTARDIIALMLAFCNLYGDNLPAAKEVFSRLIDEDVNHSLEYIPYFGMILCLLKEEKNDKALEFFSEIPIDLELVEPLGPMCEPLWLNPFDYILATFSGLEKIMTNRRILGKVRGLRGVLLYPTLSNVSRAKVLNDLKFANKHLPNNKVFCKTLCDAAIEDGNLFEVHKLTLQYMENVPRSEVINEAAEIDFSYIDTASEKLFQELVVHVRGILTATKSFPRAIADGCLGPMIKRLFKAKDFKTIAEITALVDDYYIKDTDVLFEIAYSCVELGKKDHGRRYYEMHVQKHGQTSEVANNLALLYEDDGDLRKAEKYLRKAIELSPKDETAKRNLQRVLEMRTSAANFFKEKFVVKKNLLEISDRKDVNGNITIKERDLTTILSVPKNEARQHLKYLLGNKYIISHQVRPGLNVYRINPDLDPQLSILEKEIEGEKEIALIVNNITVDQLKGIGYNDVLTLGLKKVTSNELRILLERDLKEAALAVLTKSYKTTLVLCGSMIEALLLEKIGSKNITRYIMTDGKSRPVSRMDLNDLLFVALGEKIIDDQLCHLAHALRGFRNLIHPSVEQRKKAIKVSESNARIAWDITSKLIMEL